jgi:hypothetical protein
VGSLAVAAFLLSFIALICSVFTRALSTCLFCLTEFSNVSELPTVEALGGPLLWMEVFSSKDCALVDQALQYNLISLSLTLDTEND